VHGYLQLLRRYRALERQHGESIQAAASALWRAVDKVSSGYAIAIQYRRSSAPPLNWIIGSVADEVLLKALASAKNAVAQLPR